ncbi:MAG: FAD-binding protein [Coriobacteriia bacterium]|nr:FAD-binding protein [Coriobacteriia bacterium]
MESEISRRNFVAGAAAAASVAAVAGAAMAKADEAAQSAWWLPEAWDEETDVVIVGYGAAGVSAALTAAEQGVPAITLEKSPIEDGGNFGSASGMLHDAFKVKDDDWEAFKNKIKTLSFNCLPDPSIVDDLVDNESHMLDWMTNDLGLSFFEFEKNNATTYIYKDENGKPGSGQILFRAMSKMAKEKGADIRLNSRLTDLIQDPQTKEILGVEYTATDGDGSEKHYIKANKAVILCMGGYEGNAYLQATYNHPGIWVRPNGTPYNTGDGITICQKHGAAMWHFPGFEWSTPDLRLLSDAYGVGAPLPCYPDDTHGEYIWVNEAGKRFISEEHQVTHDMSNKVWLEWDRKASKYTNMPYWIVFDQTFFDNVSLFQGSVLHGFFESYAETQSAIPHFTNQELLDQGFMFKGDTIEDLAAVAAGTRTDGTAVTIDPAGLAATVKAWNAYCDGDKDQFDSSFNRSFSLGKIETAPFYAIELTPGALNTQGGPQHDGWGRTVDVDGNVIPRLYNCGEFGSISDTIYIQGNICEALTTGRYAVIDAAKLDPQA